jgi:hypothetical protein
MITAGDDVAHLARFIPPGRTTYAAADVLEHLLGLVGPEPAATADPHAGP